MRCLLLAGGFATRLWPITERRAKPLLPIAGKPILSHAVSQIPTGIPITVSTNAVFAGDFAKWKKSEPRTDITIEIEDAGHEDQKLGALGAVARWITTKNIDDDVLLIAGDNYSEADLPTLLSLARGNPLLAAHDIGDLERARLFGTVLASGGDGELRTVTSFEEKPQHPKSTFISTGWWVLPKSVLPIVVEYAAKKPDNVGGLFEEFLHRNIQVDCLVSSARWWDIGSFESYIALHRQIVGERSMIDPASTVSADTTLKGSNVVGPKTSIQKSALTDCIVFGQSTIRDCVLTRCILDEHCQLEGIDLTDQMLRAGTVLKRR